MAGSGVPSWRVNIKYCDWRVEMCFFVEIFCESLGLMVRMTLRHVKSSKYNYKWKKKLILLLSFNKNRPQEYVLH